MQTGFRAKGLRDLRECLQPGLQAGLGLGKVGPVTESPDDAKGLGAQPEGLLPKLDDECKVPKGSDEGYLEKIKKNNKDNFRFKERPRIGRDSKGENEVGVNHYAGVVYYDVRGFCEKNKDELPLQVRELLQSAKLGFLADLFSEEKREAILAKRAAASEGKTGRDGPEKSKAEGPKRSGADKETQSAQFRGQLDALMKTLNTTEPHFVRCEAHHS